MEWLEILESAILFGAPLAIVGSTITQLIKQYILKVEGTQAFLLALGVGAVVSGTFLFINFPPASIEDGVVKGVASIVFAFLTPGFYNAVKQAARGTAA